LNVCASAQDPSNKLKPVLYRHKVEAMLKAHLPLACCTHCQFAYTPETVYVTEGDKSASLTHSRTHAHAHTDARAAP
jgi:hypothetical protein